MPVRVLWQKCGCVNESAIMPSTSGKPFTCSSSEASTSIITLLHIVVCVWHLQLQFGELALCDNIHEAYYCDM